MNTFNRNRTSFKFKSIGLMVLFVLFGMTTVVGQDLIDFRKPAPQSNENINYLYQRVTQNFDIEKAYQFDGLQRVAKTADNTTELKSTAISFEGDTDKMKAVVAEQPENLSFNIPISESSNIELQLLKSDILKNDFISRDEKGQILSNENMGAFYQGVIKGDPSSIVAINIFDYEISGMVKSDAGNYNLQQDESGLISYHLVDGVNHDHLGCQTETENTDIPSILDNDIKSQIESAKDFDKHNTSSLKNNQCGDIRVKYYYDYSVFNYFGNKHWKVRNYVMARFNETDAIYSAQPLYCIPLHFVYDVQRYNAYLVTDNDPGNENCGGPGQPACQNFLGDPLNTVQNQFSNGSADWDICAIIVAAKDSNGKLVGSGLANSPNGGHPVTGQAPNGTNGNTGYPGAPFPHPINATAPYSGGQGPFHAIGLGETSVGNLNNFYNRYVFAHEIGHSIGFGHNLNYGDLMHAINGAPISDQFLPATATSSLYAIYLIYFNAYCAGNKTSETLEETIASLKEINVFPNPATDNITIYNEGDEFEAGTNVTIEVYNLKGEIILKSVQTANKQLNVNIENLPSNQMYFIRMQTDKDTFFSQKFLKK